MHIITKNKSILVFLPISRIDAISSIYMKHSSKSYYKKFKLCNISGMLGPSASARIANSTWAGSFMLQKVTCDRLSSGVSLVAPSKSTSKRRLTPIDFSARICTTHDSIFLFQKISFVCTLLYFLKY